jgi:hypothetical protein
MRCISIVRSLYFRIFSASFFITFLSPEISTSVPLRYHRLWCLVYYYGWFCQFALVNSTICLCCLFDVFLLISVHADTSVLCLLYQYFLAYVKMQLNTNSMMCFYVLLFCQYWACWYNAVYCLIRLLRKSAFAVCFFLQYFCCMIFCLLCLVLCCHYFTFSFCFKISHPQP